MLQARPPALLVALLLVGALCAPPAQAQQELEPPEICWTKEPRALGVRVRAAEGSHLNHGLPLQLTLDDGTYYRVAWTEPLAEGLDEAAVHLPRVLGDGSEGWTLQISGGVCNADASICLAFHAETPIPARGRRRGKLVAEPGAPPRPAAEPPSEPPRPMEPETPKPGLHPGAVWFRAGQDDGVEAAFATAKASGRNLLVDFHARWCPPCDRLRDEFLTDRSRLPLLAGFVLLSADADAPASFDLKDRYHVGGYPTVLVLDPQGRELDRILGYDGQADRLAERLEGLRDAVGWDEPPEGTAPAELLRRLVAADRLDEASALLQAMKPPPHVAFEGDYDTLALAWAGLDGQAPELGLALLRALADTAPTPGLAAVHADGAARLLDELERPEEAAALRTAFEERLAGVIGSRGGVSVEIADDGSTITLSAPFQRPESLDDLATAAWYRGNWAGSEEGRQLRAEGAAAAAVAIVLDELTRGPMAHRPPEDVRFELTLPDGLLIDGRRAALARHEGRVHDLVDLLDAAELPDVSEPIYRAMTALFPDEFTWHYALAGFLTDQRAGEEALEEAKAALADSYGDNRLRAARRVAELLDADGQRGDAVDVVVDALAAPAPEQENVRTHRYRAALEELLDAWGVQEPG